MEGMPSVAAIIEDVDVDVLVELRKTSALGKSSDAGSEGDPTPNTGKNEKNPRSVTESSPSAHCDVSSIRSLVSNGLGNIFFPDVNDVRNVRDAMYEHLKEGKLNHLPVQNTLYLLRHLCQETGGLPRGMFVEPAQLHGLHRTTDGSFGNVFKLSHLGRTVAIKQGRYAKWELPDARRERDVRGMNEALFLACLSCRASIPAFLGVFYTHPSDGVSLLNIVSEWTGEGTLQHYREVRQGRPDDIKESLVKIATTLKVLHDLGIAHNDVSWRNILVGKDNRIWLCDFGSACISSATFSAEASTYGSQMEERLEIRPEEGRAWDVFMFGFVCYELCAGPLRLSLFMQFQLRTGQIPEYVDKLLKDNIPGDIQPVIKRCWGPGDRSKLSMDSILSLLTGMTG